MEFKMTENKYNPKTLIYKAVPTEKASKIVSVTDKKWREAALKEFVVLDIETTGLNKASDYILEVAAIRFLNFIETEKFVSLINPLIKIPYYVSRIHGITNKTVENSPTVDVILPGLLEFMGCSLIAAHNANFDIGFIEVWSRRLGFNPRWNYIDTVSAARKALPRLPDYKQLTVLNAIGYQQDAYHRAEDDCRGCAEILKAVFEKMKTPAAP